MFIPLKNQAPSQFDQGRPEGGGGLEGQAALGAKERGAPKSNLLEDILLCVSVLLVSGRAPDDALPRAPKWLWAALNLTIPQIGLLMEKLLKFESEIRHQENSHQRC